MILWSLILVPLIASIVIAMRTEQSARPLAMISSLLCALLAVIASIQFDWSNSGAMQLGNDGGFDLIPSLGVSISTGVDS
ncbi:MAG: hypothetical protein ACNA8P_11080, partial [Phycisphaerales bacterium]